MVKITISQKEFIRLYLRSFDQTFYNRKDVFNKVFGAKVLAQNIYKLLTSAPFLCLAIIPVITIGTILFDINYWSLSASLFYKSVVVIINIITIVIVLACIAGVKEEGEDFLDFLNYAKSLFILNLFFPNLKTMLKCRNFIRPKYLDYHRSTKKNKKSNELEKKASEEVGIWNKILKEVEDNPVEFLKTHIGENQAFLRFFKEKIYYNNRIDEGFLFFFLLIPRKKEMPLDILKTILTHNLFPVRAEYSHRMDFLNFYLPQVHTFFNDYSINQIKTFFTRRYDPDYLVFNLRLIMLNSPEIKVFPIFKNYLEFIDFVNRSVTSSPPLIPKGKTQAWIERINGVKIGPYKLTRINDSAEFYTWGKSLKNCLMRYTPNQIVFGITEGNKKVAAIELGIHGEIVQIKEKFNRSFIGEYLIRDFFEKNK